MVPVRTGFFIVDSPLSGNAGIPGTGTVFDQANPDTVERAGGYTRDATGVQRMPIIDVALRSRFRDRWAYGDDDCDAGRAVIARRIAAFGAVSSSAIVP